MHQGPDDCRAFVTQTGYKFLKGKVAEKGHDTDFGVPY